MQQLIPVFFLVLLISCANGQSNSSLPIFGEKKVHKVSRNGKTSMDTIYHTIGPFSFVNQLNDTVDNNTLKHKVFITSCFHSTFQTKTDTLLEVALDSVHRMLGQVPDFYIISYTIDPAFDTPEVLQKYCQNKHIVGKNWHFLTGQSTDSLYRFLRYKYFLVADRDTASVATGGFIHSNQIVLVDRRQRIRGFYDVAKKANINQLINDAKILLEEEP
ncbi:MAG: SCO family protein [Sphingobacteriales bacterium]|nr:MAG: SCO family protein [Sphingobacteriales bacterium]